MHMNTNTHACAYLYKITRYKMIVLELYEVNF